MCTKTLLKNECLGFIGLGAMGLPIAKNLNAAGFQLRVHTRSRTAENDSGLAGSSSCSNPMEVARNCDYLLICVSDDNALETVIFGNFGAIKTLKKNSIIIDLSTVSPKKSKSIAKRLSDRKITYLDAPVSGGTEGAQKGNLAIFLGGNKKDLSKIKHILNKIGSSIYLFEEVGKGQEVKAINQILVAGNYAAVAEAIALGENLNLPMDRVVEALSNGAANSWALENRSRFMLEDQYPLGFKLGLHYKDLCIALKEAEFSNISLPIALKVKEIEEDLIKKGYESEDISVLRRSIKNSKK